MNTENNPFTSDLYLTDGGMETTLIFHYGMELRLFSAFELLLNETGTAALKRYYKPYLDLAELNGTDFILETPTWRASADWGHRLGYSPQEMESINKDAVQFMRTIKAERNLPNDILISGNLGPRGDGYSPGVRMDIVAACEYHLAQIKAFALADVDVVTALTINYIDEAVGILKAARTLNIPAVISFTLETDGSLPSGEPLKEAIEKTDDLTDHYASHYMINCAHPTHFKTVLDTNERWKNRIQGIRANASTKSHSELDESTVLDEGDKHALANDYSALHNILPHLRVIGGCCGTDHTHIAAIAKKLSKALPK